MSDIQIAVLGGSGLYAMEGLEVLEERQVSTPFGDPSDAIIIGRVGDRKVAFLPRHGRGHRYNPSTIPVQANVWALKSLGVSWVISVAAVGSLQEEIVPRDFVIPDQIIDRTKSRVNTLFEGLAVHAQFAHPFEPILREVLLKAGAGVDVTMHDGGTYVCMEGPLFSTQAESRMYRSWGGSLIGMTALPEAKLFREAEISYASVCLATDYDSWKEEEHVEVQGVMENVAANLRNVQALLRRAVPMIPLGEEAKTLAANAIQYGIMTRPELIGDEEWARVELFLSKYLSR